MTSLSWWYSCDSSAGDFFDFVFYVVAIYCCTTKLEKSENNADTF